jgi:nitroreductase
MCGNIDQSPVADADLERIVEAAWRAPSARNNQHWDFVVVTDKAELHELSTIWLEAAHIAHAQAAPYDTVMDIPSTMVSRWDAVGPVR